MNDFRVSQAEVVAAILADLRYHDTPIVVRDLVDNLTLFVDAFLSERARRFYHAVVKSYSESANRGHTLRFADVLKELEMAGGAGDVGLWQQQMSAIENRAYSYRAHAKVLIDNYLRAESLAYVDEWRKRIAAPVENIRTEIADLVTFLTNLSIDGSNECRPNLILAQARQKNSYAPQSTGFTILDSKWKGGWRRKKLTMWLAPSGSGKSSACRSFAAENCLMHKPTLIQSFEMPKEDILFGVLSGMAYVPLETAIDPQKASTPEEYESIQKAEELIDRHVRIYDTRCGLPEMETRIRRMRAEFGVTDTILNMIDHVGIIDSETKDDNWRALDALAQGLSDVAKHQDIANLAFSQVRENVKLELRRTNHAFNIKARGSDGWYNAADVVVVSCQHNGKRKDGSFIVPVVPATVVQTAKFREMGGQESWVALKFDVEHGRMLNQEFACE